jgi:hypothetical protein
VLEEPKKKVVDVQIYPQVYEKDTTWTIRTLIWFIHLINKIYAVGLVDARSVNSYSKMAFDQNECQLNDEDVSYLGTTDSTIRNLQLELRRVSELLRKKYDIDNNRGDQDRRDQQLEHNDSVTCSKMLNAIIKCFCPVTIGSISVVDNSKPDVIGTSFSILTLKTSPTMKTIVLPSNRNLSHIKSNQLSSEASVSGHSHQQARALPCSVWTRQRTATTKKLSRLLVKRHMKIFVKEYVSRGISLHFLLGRTIKICHVLSLIIESSRLPTSALETISVGTLPR